MQMGGRLFQGVQVLGESGLRSGQLTGDCYKAVSKIFGHLNEPDRVEQRKWLKSCKEAKHIWIRFETQCRHAIFIVKSLLKYFLTHVICVNNIILCLRCTFALHVRHVA